RTAAMVKSLLMVAIRTSEAPRQGWPRALASGPECRGCGWCGEGEASGRTHAQDRHIELEQGFLLHALIGVLLADANDLAENGDAEPVALRFGIDFLDVSGNCRLFLFHPFDAIHERAELILRYGVLDRGIARVRHSVLAIFESVSGVYIRCERTQVHPE